MKLKKQLTNISIILISRLILTKVGWALALGTTIWLGLVLTLILIGLGIFTKEDVIYP